MKRVFLFGVIAIFFLPIVFAPPTINRPNGGVILDSDFRVPFNTSSGTLLRLVDFFGYWENDQNITIGYTYKNPNFLRALIDNNYSATWGISRPNFDNLRLNGFPVVVLNGNLVLPQYINALRMQNSKTFQYQRNEDLNISIGGFANIFLATRPFRIHMPVETATTGTYNFHAGNITVSQEFTILNQSDWNATIQQKRLDSFFRNRVSSSRLFYWDLKIIDANTTIEGWRPINPKPYFFEGKKYYPWLTIKGREPARFKIEYEVMPGSSGKYDLLISPEPEGQILDPYWVLSGGNAFDPIESIYPTMHDFNYVYLNSDQNLTFNGMLDSNLETANQAISDSNLLFFISFDDYNATHFIDKTRNHLDFNRNFLGGSPYYTVGNGLLATNAVIPCNPFALEFCNMMNSNGSAFSNRGPVSLSAWFRNDQGFADANSWIIGADNNRLNVEINYVNGQVLARWGTTNYTVCNASSIYEFGDKFPWLHLAIVGGSPNRIFVDGQECPSYAVQSNFVSTGTINTLAIGPPILDAYPFGVLSFDEFRFFSDALTVPEIQTLFIQQVIDKNLIFYQKFKNDIGIQNNFARNYVSFDPGISANYFDRGMFDTIAWDANTKSSTRGYTIPEFDEYDCAVYSCTFTAWIYPKRDVLPGYIFTRHQNTSANQYQYTIRLAGSSGNTKFLQFIGYVAPTTVTITSNGSMDINKWHHIAITYDKNNNAVQLWIDGNFDKNQTMGGSVSGGSAVPVFGTISAGTYNFIGKIEEAKFWNRKLDGNEIIADYNSWWRGNYTSRVFDGNGLCSDCNYSIGNVSFDRNQVMSGLVVQSRACNNETCSTNPNWTTENVITSDQNFDLNNGTGYLTNFFQFKTIFDLNHLWSRQNYDNNIIHVRKAKFLFDFLPMSLIVVFPNAANLILFEDFWIDFNVTSVSFGALGLRFDINLTKNGIEGTGVPVVTDGNVASTPEFYCDSNTLSLGSTCHAFVAVDEFPQGRYKVFAKASNDFVFASDASDNNFYLLNDLPSSGGFLVFPSQDEALSILALLLVAVTIVLASSKKN